MVWAAELSALATLMVMWWTGIQERSLSLRLSASGYRPSRPSSHLLLFSVRVTACNELVQVSSQKNTSHMSSTFFYLACQDQYLQLPYLKSGLNFSKQPRRRVLRVNCGTPFKVKLIDLCPYIVWWIKRSFKMRKKNLSIKDLDFGNCL